MSKLLENVYRSVNISLVNELKIICDKNWNKYSQGDKHCETKPYGLEYSIQGLE